ncbi:MAG: insulinase family protein [Cytophagales bacterium]|nr:insulinase family protein [Cytophagales bacterium]
MSLDRTSAPLIREPSKVEIVRAESTLLAENVNFHVIQAGVQPVVKLEVVFPSIHPKGLRPGVSFFAIKMLGEGTKSRSSQQIKEAFAFFGAHLETHHGSDKSSLVVHTLGKHLESIVPLVVELLEQPSFPAKELETLKANTIQNLRINGEKTATLAHNAFKDSMYGNSHPYGHSLSVEEVESISLEQIKEYYESCVRNVPLDIIVAGSLRESEIGTIANGFISWNTKGHIIPQFPMVKPFTREEKVVTKSGSLQATIRLGTRAVDKHDPEYFKLMILNKILGGYFGSRLMKNIREDKGYTYGISSALVNLEHAHHWVIGSDVKNEVAKDAMGQIRLEMERLTRELVPMEELATVKQYMIGTFISSSNTPFQLADKFKNIYFSNLGYVYYDS